MISSMMSRTSGVRPSTTSWSVQKSGRLNVVIPIETRPEVVRSVSTSHCASSTTKPPSPASTSNQYQPPSMNGFSVSLNSSVVTSFWSSATDSSRCT